MPLNDGFFGKTREPNNVWDKLQASVKNTQLDQIESKLDRVLDKLNRMPPHYIFKNGLWINNTDL